MLFIICGAVFFAAVYAVIKIIQANGIYNRALDPTSDQQDENKDGMDDMG